MAVASQGCRWVPYYRRHPAQTALYRAVQQHLETYLAMAAGEDDCDGQRVPAYVEREFRRYLECGILAYAFARADVQTAVVISWLPSRAQGAAFARRVTTGAWQRPPRTWSITSSPIAGAPVAPPGAQTAALVSGARAAGDQRRAAYPAARHRDPSAPARMPASGRCASSTASVPSSTGSSSINPALWTGCSRGRGKRIRQGQRGLL
jgi:hypothetical protein